MVLLWTDEKRAWQDLIKEQAREKLVRAARRSVTRILDHFFHDRSAQSRRATFALFERIRFAMLIHSNCTAGKLFRPH
jgi:hypothetical protein